MGPLTLSLIENSILRACTPDTGNEHPTASGHQNPAAASNSGPQRGDFPLLYIVSPKTVMD